MGDQPGLYSMIENVEAATPSLGTLHEVVISLLRAGWQPPLTAST
jgi:hypothetical protein